MARLASMHFKQGMWALSWRVSCWSSLCFSSLSTPVSGRGFGPCIGKAFSLLCCLLTDQTLGTLHHWRTCGLPTGLDMLQYRLPSFLRLSAHPRQRSAWASRFVCVAAVFHQSHQRFIESLAYCIHCASCAVQGCGSMSVPWSDTDKASQHFLMGRQPLLISDQ